MLPPLVKYFFITDDVKGFCLVPWRPVMEQRLGPVAASSVHPREVVKQALHHNSAVVLLAHNHLSGLAEPSVADIESPDYCRKP